MEYLFYIKMFVFLLAGHFLMDVVLQSDTVAANKSWKNKAPKGYDPDKHGPLQKVWPYFLTGHAFSHAIAVIFVTGSFTFFIIEFLSHWLIDFGKTSKLYGIHTDQGLHFAFKLLYVYLSFIGIS